jgi:hypothetical protein
MRAAANFRGVLNALCAHRVEYIVVGGVSAVLGGAPVSTFDVDIVPLRSTENVEALLATLTSLDARYRDLGGRVLRPDAQSLLGPGHHLLMTTCGPLDVLGQITGGRGYAELLPLSESIELAPTTIRTLRLEALIAFKRETGRPKDLAILPVLEATLKAR